MNMNNRVREAIDDSHDWFPDVQHNKEWLPYTLLCLGGEVGELQNKTKKQLRGSTTWEEILPILRDELVDVFVYAFNVAACLEMDLEEEYDKKRKFNDERFRDGRALLAEADNRGPDGDSGSGDSV
jgi:NTP pyrophosphatase (non-canonical NTP hydrolase)